MHVDPPTRARRCYSLAVRPSARSLSQLRTRRGRAGIYFSPRSENRTQKCARRRLEGDRGETLDAAFGRHGDRGFGPYGGSSDVRSASTLWRGQCRCLRQRRQAHFGERMHERRRHGQRLRSATRVLRAAPAGLPGGATAAAPTTTAAERQCVRELRPTDKCQRLRLTAPRRTRREASDRRGGVEQTHGAIC